MIDLAEYREEMLQYCSEITAGELQELMTSRGYNMEIRDRLPGEVDDLDDDCEGPILAAPPLNPHPKYWQPVEHSLLITPHIALVQYARNEDLVSNLVLQGSTEDLFTQVVQYTLSEQNSWDASFLIQGSFTQEVTIMKGEEISSAAANSSELALAA